MSKKNSFTGDEAFLLCLLFKMRACTDRDLMSMAVQHGMAYNKLWENMGKDTRNAMITKMDALAEHLGYPDRAGNLVQEFAIKMAKEREKFEASLTEKELPEPGSGFAKA